MIWSSVWAMTIFDLAIIAMAVAMFVLYRKSRVTIQKLQLATGFQLVMVGMLVIMSVFLLDLLSMWVLPSIVGHNTAMTMMETIHMDLNWLTSLAGFSLIMGGMGLMFRRLIPSLSHKLQDSDLALSVSEQRYHHLYNDTPAIFITVNKEYEIVSINEFGALSLGYTTHKLVGKPLSFVVDAEHYGDQLQYLRTSQTDVHCECELPLITAEHHQIWVKQSIRKSENLEGTTEYLISCQDITRNHELTSLLQFQSTHDKLTGLYNRHALERHIEALFSQQQSAEHSLLFVDVDQLKVINDTCGHEAGDEMLNQVATLIQDCIRVGDFLARMGGDEFAIVLANCPLAEATRIAENIRRKAEDHHFQYEGSSFNQSLCIGVTSSFTQQGNPSDFISTADAACYEAKETGRNRIVVSNFQATSPSTSRAEMHWVRRLNAAIKEDQFRLYFQPIVDITKQKQPPVHFEVLLRYLDENDKIIHPGFFLPAAERFHMSDQVDLWVVENILRLLDEAKPNLANMQCCAINLSGHSFTSRRARDAIVDLVRNARTDKEKLCFEITETAAISNFVEAQTFIDELKAQGCHFALDDFGSGVSSFGYLKNMPVDFLKIDGSFVKEIAKNPIDRAMVDAMNRIGHDLHLKTVAEYVEDAEILKQLSDLNVDFAQGYHLAKPMPIGDLLQYYADSLFTKPGTKDSLSAS